MKRFLICAAMAVLFLPIANTSAHVIGNVFETDIVTYIDHSPISSYNYKDYTYIIAEDLIQYGFHVEWNANQRALFVTREKYTFMPFVSDFINEKKQARTYQSLYDVYETDIQTYVNGRQIATYNIDGKTIINADDLQEFGYCTYDNKERRYDIDILSKDITDCEERRAQNDIGGYLQTSVQKGIFYGDNLLYGLTIIERDSKYGKEITSEYGDFKNDQRIDYQSTYKDYRDNYTYHMPSATAYCATSKKFQYGLYVRSVLTVGESGQEYRYLPETGELYLIREKYPSSSSGDNSFVGQIFKNGQQIYSGNIKFDNFRFYRTDQWQEITILYAPGYTDSNGIIYYSTNSYTNEPLDAVYYRGNVVNGVAHGFGIMYGAISDEISAGNSTYTLYTENGAQSYEMPIEHVLYIGNFKDGLMHGEGKMYQFGALESEGTWAEGKKNGHFREYQSISQNMGYLYFDGNYIEDVKSGYGIEYAQKGFANYEGLFDRFVGEWKDGSWSYGKWYECDYDPNTNTHKPYLNYEGEFKYGELQYGTCYRYYNEETGQYEVKTGYFLNWVFQHE